MEHETEYETFAIPKLLPGYDKAHVLNGFTLGRAYRVIRLEGNNFVLRNDNGHERVIGACGQPSPHIKAYVQPHPGSPHVYEACAGYFQIIAGEAGTFNPEEL